MKQPCAAIAAVRIHPLLPYSFLLLLMYHESAFITTDHDAGIKFLANCRSVINTTIVFSLNHKRVMLLNNIWLPVVFALMLIDLLVI